MSITIDPATIGPVDVAIIGFAGDAFNGEIAPAIRELVESGVVRIIDLAFVHKDASGNALAIELEDHDVAEAFAGLGDGQHDLLNDEDLELIAEGLEPETAALIVVWENTWAAKFSAAVRDSNGFLLSHTRIPHEAVVLAIEALQGE